MNEMKVLFETRNIRTLIIQGNPWFVAKDICHILNKVNPSESIKTIDPDDRSQASVIDALGRDRIVNIINESGLYTLLLKSKKQEALKFRDWITSEVLPSIRKEQPYRSENNSRNNGDGK